MVIKHKCFWACAKYEMQTLHPFFLNLRVVSEVGRMLFCLYHSVTHHDHHHLPPWISSFDLFRHRRIAIVSWGVHDLFFLEVCS